MAQLENSSEGVYELRTRLNEKINELKEIKNQSDRYVDDIKETWNDHRYQAFETEYKEVTQPVNLLFEKMEEYDKKLLGLQEALIEYEEG